MRRQRGSLSSICSSRKSRDEMLKKIHLSFIFIYLLFPSFSLFGAVRTLPRFQGVRKSVTSLTILTRRRRLVPRGWYVLRVLPLFLNIHDGEKLDPLATPGLTLRLVDPQCPQRKMHSSCLLFSLLWFLFKSAGQGCLIVVLHVFNIYEYLLHRQSSISDSSLCVFCLNSTKASAETPVRI